jgi:outer membrane receptor protein involved in Fe transport
MMGLIGYRALAFAGCTAISLSLSIPAYAQTIALPEITILGELIERRSQDATTSVGVITNERIQQEQILDFHDALNATANALSTRGSSNNSGITIRGINSEGLSQNQSANSAPVIGVIVDGAMQNAEAVRRGVRSIWDVEQVEILRGPQSTLQGKNTAAGAVLVKTKDPTFSWQAMAELTAGTHELFSTGVMLSGPLIPNELAFRVAGQIYRAENDIRYSDPGNARLGEDRFGNIRGKILWTPASIPGLRALFTVAHTDDRPSTNAVTGPDFFARVYTQGLINTSVDFRSTKTNNYISDISYALTGALKIRSVTAYAATDTDVSTAPGNIAYIRGDDRRGSDFTQDFRLELENSGNGFSGVAVTGPHRVVRLEC